MPRGWCHPTTEAGNDNHHLRIAEPEGQDATHHGPAWPAAGLALARTGAPPCSHSLRRRPPARAAKAPPGGQLARQEAEASLRRHESDHKWPAPRKQPLRHPTPRRPARRRTHVHCRRDGRTPEPGGPPPCHQRRRRQPPQQIWAEPNPGSSRTPPSRAHSSSTSRPSTPAHSTCSSAAGGRHRAAAARGRPPTPPPPERGEKGAPPPPTLTGLCPPARPGGGEEEEGGGGGRVEALGFPPGCSRERRGRGRVFQALDATVAPSTNLSNID